MDNEDYEQSRRYQLSFISTTISTNPIETIYNNQQKNKSETKNKKTIKYPIIVKRQFISHDKQKQSTFYESSCDEDEEEEDEEEEEAEEVEEEEGDEDITHQIPFDEKKLLPSTESNDNVNYDLLIDNPINLVSPLSSSVSSRFSSIPNSPCTKKAKIEKHDDYCFFCEWESKSYIRIDKLIMLKQYLEKSYYVQEKEKIVKQAHLFYMEEIYKPLKSQGCNEIKPWTSKSILTHINKILDPRIQLLGKSLDIIDRKIEELDERTLELVTYETEDGDHYDKEEVNDKAHKNLLAYLKEKRETYKLKPRELAFFNEGLSLDTTGAGASITNKNFSIKRNKI